MQDLLPLREGYRDGGVWSFKVLDGRDRSSSGPQQFKYALGGYRGAPEHRSLHYESTFPERSWHYSYNLPVTEGRLSVAAWLPSALAKTGGLKNPILLESVAPSASCLQCWPRIATDEDISWDDALHVWPPIYTERDRKLKRGKQSKFWGWPWIKRDSSLFFCLKQCKQNKTKLERNASGLSICTSAMGQTLLKREVGLQGLPVG